MRAARILAVSALAASLGLAVLPGCEKLDRNMYDNPAYKPQEDPVRVPPAGSIPTKGIERVPAPGDPAAAKLANPVAPTEGNLSKGKELFGIFCVPCHGASGRGDGPVAKKYVPTVADISRTGHGSHHPDGELFAVITHGRGGMPAFRFDLSADERWKIVAWLRKLE